MEVLLILIIETVIILIIAKFKGFNPWAWLLTAGLIGFFIIIFLPSGKDSSVDEETQRKRRASGTNIGIWVSIFAIIVTVILMVYMNNSINNYNTYNEYNSSTFETNSAEKTNESIINSDNDQSINSVVIGSQTWMTDNLNVSTFRNGDPILEAKTKQEWINAGEENRPAWCNYENNDVYGNGFGKLYNWYAVNDPRGLAPDGWHIPNDKEWTDLINELGGENIAGIKMKYPSTKEKSIKELNESKFNGMLSGSRFGTGDFEGVGYYGCMWSSTNNSLNSAWIRQLDNEKNNIERLSKSKDGGLSVRCVKGSSTKPISYSNPSPTTPSIVQEGWQTIYIKDVGSFDIPPTMEIKDNNYTSYYDEIKKVKVYDEIKLVAQQKGLNNNSKEGFEKYARVIVTNLKSPLGEMESLYFDFSTFTESEMTEIDNVYKLQSEQELKMIDMKMIEWYPAKFEKINGMSSLHISYKRQMKDQPFVIVHMYIFHNKDLIPQLTLSYRQSEEYYWKSDFEKILKSFKITNIR